jgi:predicted nucleic acid-binding protein
VEVDVKITACRDESDNKFLELAVSGGDLPAEKWTR